MHRDRTRNRHGLRASGIIGLAILGFMLGSAADLRADSPPEAARVPLLSPEEAWAALPECSTGSGAPLPNWARALASSLPHTTAAMLELDAAYRTTPELDAALRAKLRWVAAHANRCVYGQRYAAADLARAGGDAADLELLAAGFEHLPADERAVLEFGHQMTVDANEVSDQQVAGLIELYGERQVVAFVLQLAYANFQDRLVLALDVPLEEGGPLPPGDFQFPALAKTSDIAPAPRPEALPESTGEDPPVDAGLEWSPLDMAQLRELLETQRERPGRVSVPAWERVREQLPAELYPRERPLKVKWSLVVLGHQPELGLAWMRCLRTFGREADLDRVLAESIFWVITRTIHCFY
jgi:alkylhydroperoxidase family enzyme